MARRRTRFVLISDTHNQTPKLPAGDVLIHAGDLSNTGSHSELRKTVDWLQKAPFEVKIVVAGNHDVTLDEAFYADHGAHFHNQHPENALECVDLLRSSPSITYLAHESRTVALQNGTTFSVFGSPYSPYCGATWAFQYPRDDAAAAAAAIWNDIPLDTDVLVTHAPPQHHCDANATGHADGCKALREALWRIRPCMHVCGHRHEGRGAERVRWKIDQPMFSSYPLEERTHIWADPGAGTNKLSLVDLSARGGNPLDNDLARSQNVVSNSVSFSASPSAASDAVDLAYANVFSQSLKRSLSKRGLEAPQHAVLGQNATSQPDGRAVTSRLDSWNSAALNGRMGRRETCVINAAIMAQSYGRGPKRFNKPIVVDIDLPEADYSV
ncbi:calcineurin-like phosphoesterase [Phyllosticta citriasiana]|uniref:Calcineurin-like phosphoesterase n=1 Tax=Phyllosticta citriasiana TaxID=595635 RepID=A0ABR1KZU1_9PEZI